MLIGMLLPMLVAAQTDQLWLANQPKESGWCNLYSDLSKKDLTEQVIEKELAGFFSGFKKVKVSSDKVANFHIIIDDQKKDNLGAEGYKLYVKLTAPEYYTIVAETPAGALYGVYAFLRMKKLGAEIVLLSIQ